MKQIIAAVCGIYLIAALSSCTKTVYGCTDPTASNYNSSANASNGSCTYVGQVNFWTPTNYGVITVDVTNTSQSSVISSNTITSYYSSGVPSCGASGCATFTLPVGTYSFTATNNSGTTWNTNNTINFTVTTGVCQNEELQ